MTYGQRGQHPKIVLHCVKKKNDPKGKKGNQFCAEPEGCLSQKKERRVKALA